MKVVAYKYEKMNGGLEINEFLIFKESKYGKFSSNL